MGEREAPARRSGSAPEARAPLPAGLARRLAVRPGRRVPDEPGVARAAVALVLRPAAEAEALFVHRADRPADPWAGHVALPGGRADPGDVDLLDTARRELREETAIELDRADVLGRLDDIRPVSAHLPPVAVTPFVAWLDRPVRVRESAELAGHFWVPVSTLQDPGRRTTLRRAGPPERLFPAIAYGERAIWGLTFRIVEDFLERWREAGG